LALKNYYELLEIVPTASLDDVKRAFRGQIAKYHPDKVHHLGKEFQAMAADRAAELTEAYRTLSDDGRRAEYDRAFAEAGGAAAVARPAAPAAEGAQTESTPGTSASPPPPHPSDGRAPVEPPRSTQFTNERATRDEFVRKATVNRLRQALEAVASDYDESDVRGFDIACVPKKKFFASAKNPRLLGRFVSAVDREAVADAWSQAVKWSPSDAVCVLLMGTSLAPAGELAREIGDQRRKHRSGRLTLVPVNARDWDAHMPFDAPAIAKTLLARLKKGA
jgi:curved DNA-binding protein CbpA